MYERFAERARKVMQLANHEAQRFNHEYIGTEHILLGLVKEGSGVAARVLGAFDLDLRKLRLEVEKIVQSGPDMVTMGKLPLTPRAKMALKLAWEEGETLNHNWIDTEDLLLGLIREREGVAAQILLNLGLTLEEVRQATLECQGVAPPAAARKEPTFLIGQYFREVDGGFTARAQKALQLANQEAHRLSHDHIGTEHLLLGLMKESDGRATEALKNCGLSLSKLRKEVETVVPPLAGNAVFGKLPLTPRAQAALRVAKEEAAQLAASCIGTEHLLLALLDDDDCVATQVILALEVEPAELLEELLSPDQRKHRNSRNPVVKEKNPAHAWLRRTGRWLRRHQTVLLFDFGLWSALIGAFLGVVEGDAEPLTGAALGGTFAASLTAAVVGWEARRRSAEQSR
jgi:ATP-dependent Clp protease ATP-binding subunit ClpA